MWLSLHVQPFGQRKSKYDARAITCLTERKHWRQATACSINVLVEELLWTLRAWDNPEVRLTSRSETCRFSRTDAYVVQSRDPTTPTKSYGLKACTLHQNIHELHTRQDLQVKWLVAVHNCEEKVWKEERINLDTFKLLPVDPAMCKNGKLRMSQLMLLCHITPYYLFEVRKYVCFPFEQQFSCGMHDTPMNEIQRTPAANPITSDHWSGPL